MANKPRPGNRIAEFREKLGWSMQRLADEVGTTASQINKLEKSHRRLSDVWLRRLAPVLGCSQGELLGEPSPKPPHARRRGARAIPITIVGEAGAGDTVFHFPEADADHDELELGPDDEWILVKGRSMEPYYFARDLIRLPRDVEPPEKGLRRVCLVKLKDGRLLIKEVARGSKPGRYTLRSFNAPEIPDVEIDWVKPFHRRAIVIW